MSIFQLFVHTISGDIEIANPLGPLAAQIVGNLIRWESRHNDAYSPGLAFPAWIYLKLELFRQPSTWNRTALNERSVSFLSSLERSRNNERHGLALT